MSLKYLEISLDKNFIGVTTRMKDYHVKLVTDMGQKPKYCSFRVAYNNNNDKIIGYTLVENLTADTLDEKFAYGKLQSCLICCKSVNKVTIKYIDATSGHQKEIDLLSIPSYKNCVPSFVN